MQVLSTAPKVRDTVVGPSEWTGSGCWFNHQPGMLILEPRGAEIAEGGVEPSPIVGLFDEARQAFEHVGERLEGHGIDAFNLERLHEALGLSIVIRVAASSHRANKAVLGEMLPVRLGSLLRPSVGMVDAAFRWFAGLDCPAEGGQGETRVDCATNTNRRGG